MPEGRAAGRKLPEFVGANSARLSTYRARRPKTLQPPDPKAFTARAPYRGLTGMSYKTQDGQTFHLPNRGVLVNEFRKSGMEVWPAKSSGRVVGKSSVKSNDYRAEITKARPAFLEQMERFIEQRLMLIPASNRAGPSLERYRVYSEAFDHFVGNFTSYRTLLGRISSEYDRMIQHYISQIHIISPLQDRLAALKDECDDEIRRVRTEQESELQAVRDRIDDAEGQILQFQDREAKLDDEIRLLNGRLLDIEEQCRDQWDTNRSILTSIQQIMNRKERAEDVEAIEHRQRREKLELETAHANLNTALVKLNDLKNLYNMKEPRGTLDDLVQELKSVGSRIFHMTNNYEKLLERTSEVSEANAETQRKIRELREERDRLTESTRSFTPRPQWERLNQYSTTVEIDGVSSRDLASMTYEIIQQKREELMELRRHIPTDQQLAEETESFSSEEVFQGLGTGPDVPKYLRTKAPVKNHRMMKRDCEMLIKEVWASKRAADKGKPQKEKMENWFYTFLMQRFQSHSVVVEWGYNMMDALERYAYDPDCSLFYDILTGELGEEVWDDQLRMVAQVQNLFVDMAKQEDGTVAPKLFKADVIKAVRDFFSAKCDADFEDLLTALDNEQAGDWVEYKQLFVENREGNETEFVETIREQYMEERKRFLEMLDERLADSHRLKLSELRAIVKELDPDRSAQDVNRLLAKGFSEASKDLKKDRVVNVDEWMKKIRWGVLKRTTKFEDAPGSDDEGDEDDGDAEEDKNGEQGDEEGPDDDADAASNGGEADAAAAAEGEP